MPKTIDVTFKALGNRTLTATFDPTSLNGKNFDQVAELVLAKNWNGEDARTAGMIRKQMDASGGRRYRVAEGFDENLPTRFTPIETGKPVADYVKPYVPGKEQVGIEVLGSHVVGYS